METGARHVSRAPLVGQVSQVNSRSSDRCGGNCAGAVCLALGMSAVLWTNSAAAQQIADTTFFAEIADPAFEYGRGPVVLIDEAHHNYHTAEGRYLAFATLLRRDGYDVRASRGAFTSDLLSEAGVLVISNALNEANERRWSLPTPSAFTRGEIAAVRGWIERGGSLMLIADHMPFPGAAADMAAQFGITFMNGFAFASLADHGPVIFRRSDNSLTAHPITQGRDDSERVDSVVTFTGQAFQIPADARPLLVFRSGAVSLNPVVAWEFAPETPRADVGGWSQGAVMRWGRGRVAVFGEAAMFSAQVAGPERQPMGMNRPEAVQNQQFLLNVMHWLTGQIDER